ncbi:MAG: sigma-70 family RNA polymerase sigma factor [bacterium]|nr:sigma-70 family RNA polymerase sigma factor [bacterium]
MEYKSINDFEVLYMISENDENAYELMYKKYSPLVSKFAKEYAKKFNNIGIEYDDIFQQGMYGLSIAIKKYNSNEKTLFYTFALTCVKREMINLLRKSITNNNNLLNRAISIDEPIYDNGLILEEVCEDNRNRIENVINSIEYTRRINELKYYVKDINMPIVELKLNGFSNKEIAILLDIKYKQVDNGIRSIKNSLSKITD